MIRRTLTLALLAVAALTMSACGTVLSVGLDRVDAVQVDVIGGKAKITPYVCADGTNGTDTGDTEDACGDDKTLYDADQVLVGFRVPEGTGAPGLVTGHVQTFNEGSGVGEADVRFDRDRSYEAELERVTAPGGEYEGYGAPGTRWIGYRSEVLPEDASGELTFDPELEVDSEDRDDFRVLTVVGARLATAPGSPTMTRSDELVLSERHERLMREYDVTREELFRNRGYLGDTTADRDVDCEETDIIDGPSTVCIDDPDVPRELSAPLRQMTIGGGEGFAAPGTAAVVPFRLTTTGPPVADHAVALSAVTDLPGATATPQWDTTDLPSGEVSRDVVVEVPAGAEPGTYTVELTAVAGDEVRKGVGAVVVLPGTASLEPSKDDARESLAMGDDGTISFTHDCASLCGSLRASVLSMKSGIAPAAQTAQAGKPRLLKIGTALFTGVAGKPATVKLRLYTKAQRAIDAGRTIKAIIVVRRNGAVAPIVRRVTISKGS